jgi:hypothetical protein
MGLERDEKVQIGKPLFQAAPNLMKHIKARYWLGWELNVADWIGNAIMLVVGAFIVFVLIQTLTSSYPEFGTYGWTLMGAYIVGAAFYLRYALRKN